MAFLKVLRDEELWSGESYATTLEGVPVLLFRDGTRICAFKDRCAHKGVRISEGRIQRGRIVCPAHLWEYELSSGRSVCPEGMALTPLPIKVVNGWIAVEVVEPSKESA